jgi:hypothetical protein
MRGLQRGDPIQINDGITMPCGNDVVVQLRCDEFTRFRAAIATGAATATTPEMIVETTC